MKVKIKITEGCTAYSYTINNKKWSELVDNESKYYDLDFVNNVCASLINEIQEQYQLPNWVIYYFWDGCDSVCEQYTFINLVKNDKNTKEKYLGYCDQCGDSIYSWSLEIDLKSTEK